MRLYHLPAIAAGCAVLTVFSGLSPSTVYAQSGASVAQAELIRRQESLMRNSKAVNTAAELIKQGNFAEARPMLEKVIAEVNPTGPGLTVVNNAKLLLSQVEMHDATEAYKNKEWLIARDRSLKALEYDPQNKAAKRLYDETNKMVGGSPTNPKQINPAIDQKFITNINRVSDLIKLGQDQLGTGQFDKAEASFQQALAIDRGNKVAAKELEKVYAAQIKLAEVNTASSNKQKMFDVQNNWAESFKVDVLANTQAPEEAVAIRRSNNFNINQKLKNIIIKNINFDQGTTIEDAASFLTLKSREEDPAHEGVSFLIRSDDTKAGARPFALSLKNVPLIDALRYITNLAGVKYKVEEYAVFIVPITSREETLIRREFRVPADFFDTGLSGGAAPAGGGSERRTPIQSSTSASPSDQASVARKALEARGVVFGEGAIAIYSPASSTLTVLNTQDQIDYIEELVSDGGQQETLMVKVETRIVEINQDDLNSLSVNYTLAGNFTGFTGGVSGSYVGASGVNAGTTMVGPNGLPSSSIASLLQIGTNGTVADATNPQVAQNQLNITGFLDGNGFSILMAALNQKRSFNTITAPSVVVLDKATGTINVSREFRFPTTYDAPETSPRTLTFGLITVAAAPTIIPAWPSGFGDAPGDEGFAEIGVTSTVTPQVQPNRKSVRLTINPQVLDFDGFVNYGVPISTVVPANPTPVFQTLPNPAIVSNNVIRVPIFSRRSIDRNTVEIEDGYTLVLGGLIRENIDTLDEKVPFLGDLPMVGRAFRSKSEHSVKKNLMIFITVRIIRPNGEPLNVLASEIAKAK